MLQNTFLHLPRVGKTKEAALWKRGIHDWEQFLNTKRIKGFAQPTKLACDQCLLESKRALWDGHSEYFTQLPSAEQWRTWDAFKEEAIFVDIETDWRGDVTVLGIYDGHKVRQYIKGINLNTQAVREALRAKLIVTYNGASFDLPVLRRRFGNIIPKVPHVDIRHVAARLGHKGGLKILEGELGVLRPYGIAGMSGDDALHLWELYRASGDERYLQRLLAYNEEDITNLPFLTKTLVLRLTSLLGNTRNV
jgi:hypothetical protein